MPSPIGHSLCGYAVYSATQEKGKKINWKQLLGFIVIANLADIDYLPGFLIGRPNEFHHQFTHSFVFALIVVAAIAFFSKKKKYLKNFIVIFLLYTSHILTDFLGRDTSLPYGEQLFWPFSNEYYLSSFSIFQDMQKANTSAEFFPKLLTYHNLSTMLMEVFIFAAIIILVKMIRNKIYQKWKIITNE